MRDAGPAGLGQGRGLAGKGYGGIPSTAANNTRRSLLSYRRRYTRAFYRKTNDNVIITHIQ